MKYTRNIVWSESRLAHNRYSHAYSKQYERETLMSTKSRQTTKLYEQNDRIRPVDFVTRMYHPTVT